MTHTVNVLAETFEVKRATPMTMRGLMVNMVVQVLKERQETGEEILCFIVLEVVIYTTRKAT